MTGNLVCALALIWSLAAGPATPVPVPGPMPAEERILIIGNSYTFYNNMPEIFRQIAAADGHSPEITVSAAPGAGLSRAFNDEELIASIAAGTFSHIVLQPGSGLGSHWRIDGQTVAPRTSFGLAEPLARFAEAAASTQTRLLVIEPWRMAGRPDADMEAIRFLVNEALPYDGRVDTIPVGVAFSAASGLELYQADGFHPSATGSVLFALGVYQAIYGSLPAGNLPEIFSGPELVFSQVDGQWGLRDGETIELAHLDPTDWQTLHNAASTAATRPMPGTLPPASAWPELPATNFTATVQDYAGVWQGETRHHPAEWPWPAEIHLNLCPAGEAMRAELTYVFHNEDGSIARREHVHMPAALEDGQITMTRADALWQTQETLQAVLISDDEISGIASLRNENGQTRVEGHWTARRIPAQWHCFGER